MTASYLDPSESDKVAWYGINRVRSSNLQITAGIVIDDVRSVVLEEYGGRHEVDTSANAFFTSPSSRRSDSE